MKKIKHLAAVSSLLALASLYPGAASPATIQASAATGSTGFTLPILTPKPVQKTCSVVFANAQDDNVTTAKNTAVTFSPLFNDTYSTQYGLESFEQPSHGTVVRSGVGGLKYTPNAGYVGSDSFDYTVGGCLQCYQGGCVEPDDSTAFVHITVTN